MDEAIVKAKRELEEYKTKEKADIKKRTKELINEAEERYLFQIGRTALDEVEKQYKEALILSIFAAHNCENGFKEGIEELLEVDDIAASLFMNMRPLILALHNLATHGNTEALSILLSYFNRNLDKLSLENKSDCFLLKRYYEEKTSLGKEVSEWYKWSDDILKNHNCRESNTNYNWTPLHAAVHHGDIQFVKYLASNGAQLVKDSKGKLPHEVHFWDTCTNPEIRKPKYQECVKFVKEKYDSINQDEKSIVDEHFQQMVQIILSDVKSGIIASLTPIVSKFTFCEP